MSNDTLTAIEGIRVGHAVIEEALTGCTVVQAHSSEVGRTG